jgi:hypothetical protein
MNKLKKAILSLSIIFFTACGSETQINPSLGFDMWDYMTSARNYEVEYDVYENGLKTDYYAETNRQYGSEYERVSSTGVTKLLQGNYNSQTLLQLEPDNTSITIYRYLYLGDSGIFQSPDIQLCSLERFYDSYQNKGLPFYNVIQVNCTYRSGFYQEFYYGYNEGIVHIYQNDNGHITEFAKVGEREII